MKKPDILWLFNYAPMIDLMVVISNVFLLAMNSGNLSKSRLTSVGINCDSRSILFSVTHSFRLPSFLDLLVD